MPCFGHYTLEMAALWPLCARNRGAVATVRSKWLCCGHFGLEMAAEGGLCALEMAALWPLCAGNGCTMAPVRSNWLRSGHCALEKAALWPLRLCLSFLRSHCAASSCALCGFTGSTVPIFPSESLCCFELCFVRLHWFDCAYLPSESLCCFELCFVWLHWFDCAYLSFGVTVLLRAVLCAASLAP